MFKRMTCLMLVVLVLGLAHRGWGATKIIIVTNNPADEASYTPFLRNLLGNDITVEAEDDKYIDPLSTAAKADLNAADLIIVSRRTSSGKFVTGIPFWNGLAVPLVLHSSFLIGDDRWRWMPGGTQNVDVTRVGVVDGNDPVFDGVTITGGQVEISSTVLAGVDVSNQNSVGNGTKIATPAGSDKVMIARWAAGIEYYPGSGHIAGGPRLFFGMRTDEFLPFINDNGKKMLGNAILSILGRLGSAPTASDPKPANAQMDVARDTLLSWTPGIVDGKHDVYFGTVSQSVNDASRANPQGVLAGQNVSGNEYDPAGLLEFGRTYYWRVDEVNAVNLNISKGDVWSFTVEPYVYPIKNIVATASSAEVGMGPENTVNGSGLNANDQHSTELKDMWLSAGVQPNWIQFAFDKVYKLRELWVWNSNQVIEKVVGFGARSVTIEYSVDGSTWTPLAGVPEFAKATGAATYAHNTTISFGGVSAKYVKLSINSSWAGVPQASLSEVRFFYVPVQAREPVPADAATGVDPSTVLSWRAGREAAVHELYFSPDRQAVADGIALVGRPSGASYAPSPLELGTTYYWKVVEVNEAAGPSAWESDVWGFSTRPLSVIDDFEGYTNDSPNRVFQTWIDGLGFSKDEFFPNGNAGNGTGALVGYDPAGGNIMETAIIHGGKQAMPVEYNNVNQPYYSEVERTWPTPQDWTANGADTLVLYVRGNPVRFSQTSSDTITMSAAGTDIWNTADELRFASKRLNGNGTILVKVNGIENTNAWVKAGVMIRESLDPGSRFAAVYGTPGNGVHFQARAVTAGAATSDSAVSTTEQTALKAPVWIKLERSGNSFSGFYSTDGVKWTAMSWNPQTVNMTGNIYVGLAISSHVVGVPATAEFSAISMTGGVTGAWEVADIGVTHPGNDPSSLYVVVQDSAGKVKVVSHPDPAATNVASWQEWRISLSDFSGVNMAGVKKLSIGVGNRASPKVGGAGMLYIDDILVGHPAP
jgi:regulation of enolase protein 1 (concanavalin A-like superfamily)